MLNMSIHHMDIYRFLFGDPERILVSVRTDPRTDFRTLTDGVLYPEYADGLRAVGIDNTFSWVDHGIEWRVEGTEGVAMGPLAGPTSGGEPQHDRFPDQAATRLPVPAAVAGAVVPAGVHRHHGPVDAPSRRDRARDLRSRQSEDDGPARGGLPLGERGARGRPALHGGGAGMTVNPFRLDGRVAIVTGGGGGLGSGICPAWRGRSNGRCAGRTRRSLDHVATDVNAAGGHAIAVEVDIADETGHGDDRAGVSSWAGSKSWSTTLPSTTANRGRRPRPIGTAGHQPEGLLPLRSRRLPCAADVWARPGHQRRLDHLLRRHPKLARLCRLEGRYRRVYAGAGAEVGPDGITVNTSRPEHSRPMPRRSIPTWKTTTGDPRRPEYQAPRHPEDVGNLVTFLAGDAASFITGQLIQIDGGWMMH